MTVNEELIFLLGRCVQFTMVQKGTFFSIHPHPSHITGFSLCFKTVRGKTWFKALRWKCRWNLGTWGQEIYPKNAHSSLEGVKHSSPKSCEYEPKLKADKRLEMQSRFIDKELWTKAIFKWLNILKAFENMMGICSAYLFILGHLLPS